MFRPEPSWREIPRASSAGFPGNGKPLARPLRERRYNGSLRAGPAASRRGGEFIHSSAVLCAEPIARIGGSSAMPVVRVVNPLARADWDNWISNAPGAMFFHSAAWARVLQGAYGLTPLYF